MIKKNFRPILAILFLLLFAITAVAELVYKYEAADGTTHYVQYKPTGLNQDQKDLFLSVGATESDSITPFTISNRNDVKAIMLADTTCPAGTEGTPPNCTTPAPTQAECEAQGQTLNSEGTACEDLPPPPPPSSTTPILDGSDLSVFFTGTPVSDKEKLESVLVAIDTPTLEGFEAQANALNTAQGNKFTTDAEAILASTAQPTNGSELESLGNALAGALNDASNYTEQPTQCETGYEGTPPNCVISCEPGFEPNGTGDGCVATPPAPPTQAECEAQGQTLNSAGTACEDVPNNGGGHHGGQHGNMPTVNTALNAPQGVSSNTLDIKAATDTADQTASGGQFRIQCGFSHMLNDDPIVFPGQPGASHHHTFFGNTSTNANSDPMTFSSTGNSTCHGGIANRSAYWNPSLINTINDEPLKPKWALFYYKTPNPGAVTVPPKGLQMIAGDATATSSQWPDQWTKQPIRWLCNGDYNTVSPHIMACGGELDMFIQFPECWDGLRLTTTDQSHMARYNGGCPSTHPILIPTVTMNVHYDVSNVNSNNLRLASDNYVGGPGGYSLHGDWINGWNEDSDKNVMNVIVNNCLKQGLDCHANLLNNGQELYNKHGQWDQNTVPQPLNH